MNDRFEWHALMAAGIRGLGLKPAEFWALTPAELAFMLGHGDGRLAMDRQALDALASRFPDTLETRDE